MPNPTVVYHLVKALPPKTPVYGGGSDQKGYVFCKESS